MEATERAGAQRTSPAIAVLTAALARGDEEAFRHFHALYFDRLFRFHVVLARGDEAAAGDALQETFLRLVRNVRTFEEEETFWCWLTVLCRSAAADGGRKRQRYWKLLSRYARSLISPAPCASQPEQREERLHEVVTQSLGELEAANRRLVEGKYFRRATMKELSEESGLSERAVESRLLRARRELREKIVTKLNYEKQG